VQYRTVLTERAAAKSGAALPATEKSQPAAQ